MKDDDLESSRNIDLAAVALDYESFRKLASNPHLSVHERIGFPVQYRENFEQAIFQDICRKLPNLESRNKVIVDVGPGCANLPRMLIDLCERNGHRLVLVDSAEMLDQLPDRPHVHKVTGFFPRNVEEVRREADGPVDAILSYSVLQYLFSETNPFHVMDVMISLLADGGEIMLGDIPNASKRKRFFTSVAGIRFHREFTGRDDLPPLPAGVPLGLIDDSVLSGLIARAQGAGCDAYLVPQPANLPMANRRDDLLVRKP
ncbi:class I SAM-dependent methyltransferase [Bradyrhizobium sp. 45]|uniref:class I SAM-dependent methyltransferase n=1 Tax=Bradyrhizobium sp. 45 TaxID=1043587 RepID=UPI001FFAA9B4|nr:class I SAM-dependent methyltransferase [Bradyrhizobium sp. 45]MCK1305751.1 SAM-dependent methyltransferase [Bradyrhizobium sp. 45]